MGKEKKDQIGCEEMVYKQLAVNNCNNFVLTCIFFVNLPGIPQHFFVA